MRDVDVAAEKSIGHDLGGKPWNNLSVPADLFYPKGLLGDEERRMLYFLASSVYRGQGVIVDAGAFLGASAFALARGLEASAVRAAVNARIHSYDLFCSSEFYIRKFLDTHFNLKGEVAEYRSVFDFQTGLVRDRIVAVEGDFSLTQAPDAPIEILFIDVAKTLHLNSHLVRSYFSKLIPGISILIQQDYYHCWHPYIHMTMEYLKEYFTILDPLVRAGSRLYLLERAIPAVKLDRVAAFSFSFDEQQTLLDAAISSDRGETRVMTCVAQILHCVQSGRLTKATALATALQRDPDYHPDSFPARELSRVLPSPVMGV